MTFWLDRSIALPKQRKHSIGVTVPAPVAGSPADTRLIHPATLACCGTLCLDHPNASLSSKFLEEIIAFAPEGQLGMPPKAEGRAKYMRWRLRTPMPVDQLKQCLERDLGVQPQPAAAAKGKKRKQARDKEARDKERIVKEMRETDPKMLIVFIKCGGYPQTEKYMRARLRETMSFVPPCGSNDQHPTLEPIKNGTTFYQDSSPLFESDEYDGDGETRCTMGWTIGRPHDGISSHSIGQGSRQGDRSRGKRQKTEQGLPGVLTLPEDGCEMEGLEQLNKTYILILDFSQLGQGATEEDSTGAALHRNGQQLTVVGNEGLDPGGYAYPPPSLGEASAGNKGMFRSDGDGKWGIWKIEGADEDCRRFDGEGDGGMDMNFLDEHKANIKSEGDVKRTDFLSFPDLKFDGEGLEDGGLGFMDMNDADKVNLLPGGMTCNSSSPTDEMGASSSSPDESHVSSADTELQGITRVFLHFKQGLDQVFSWADSQGMDRENLRDQILSEVEAALRTTPCITEVYTTVETPGSMHERQHHLHDRSTLAADDRTVEEKITVKEEKITFKEEKITVNGGGGRPGAGAQQVCAHTPNILVCILYMYCM